MSKIQETDYWVPEHVRDYLSKMGFHLPLEAMEGRIRAWHGWMAATGDFYDYRDASKDKAGTSPSPSESAASSHGSWAPHSPSESESTYRIVTVCFDERGNIIEPVGVCGEFDTGCTFPTFAIVKPAIDNTRVDMSPYGQSVFADAVDAIQAVDLTFDALINEIDVSKMRVFLSDVLFDRDEEGNGGKKRRTPIPFGKQDCTVFRKVMSSDDMIQDFAPALRTNSQAEAFRIALQMLGDLCGFGISYFDFDDSRGYDRDGGIQRQ